MDSVNIESQLVEIDYQSLAPDTLRAVIESFVLREGTDYGVQEASFDSKIKAVVTQLKNKKAKLVFDPESETCTILLERELQRSR